MRQATRLVIGFVAVLCGGTALAQPPSPPRGTNYFPLAKGMKWVYLVGGTEVTVVVAGIERFNDEDCFRVETKTGTATRAVEFYAVRADGVYRTRVKDDALLPPVKVLPIPARAGDAWAVGSKVGFQAIKGTMAVKSDRERVTVPAGEFDAVFVEGKDFDIAGTKTTIRIWFAKDRGIVQEEFVSQGGEKVQLQLSRFERGEWPLPAPEPPALSAWAFPQTCRILPQCAFISVTTQESSGCCARPVRCWVRRR